MIILVTADNFLLLFLGWEGVGLSSYLLVNFWYTRIAANHASLKAFLMNRIGDLGLTLGIILWLIIYGTFNMELASFAPINSQLLQLGGILIILGAITKSAQIGLHSWLTSAMEGPTPVSALLHAATMVTAGIYLILRLHLFIEWSSTLLLLLAWFGGISALVGALGGLIEQDIKKIIAYSTISQLGYMFISIGFSYYSLSLWHLVNHAFFKALLFLSAGALLHSVFDIQDLRKFGSLSLKLPLLSGTFLLGNLSIIAFPFMTGFYSKDEILLVIYQANSFLFLLIFIAALITASYSIKIFINSFLVLPNIPFNIWALIHKIHPILNFVLILLTLGSIFYGYLCSGAQILSFSSLPLTAHLLSLSFFIPATLGLLFFGLFILLNYLPATLLFKGPLNFLNLLYINFISRILYPISAYFSRSIEGGLFEILLGGTGIIKLIDGLAWRTYIIDNRTGSILNILSLAFGIFILYLI